MNALSRANLPLPDQWSQPALNPAPPTTKCLLARLVGIHELQTLATNQGTAVPTEQHGAVRRVMQSHPSPHTGNVKLVHLPAVLHPIQC